MTSGFGLLAKNPSAGIVANGGQSRNTEACVGGGAVVQGTVNCRSVTKEAKLEKVDVIVENSQGDKPAGLDIKLHNTGGRRVVLAKADVNIEDVTRLDLCYTQGDLPSSNGYSAVLPVTASAVSVPLHQQLGPDEADRFSLTFGVRARDIHGKAAGDAPHMYLVRVSVSITHDGSRLPLPLGQFIFSAPSLPFGVVWYWPKALEGATRKGLAQNFGLDFPYEDYMPCWRANTTHLRNKLAATGARSPEMDQVRSDLAVQVSPPR